MPYNQDGILYRPDGSILNPKEDPLERFASRPAIFYEWRLVKKFPFYRKIKVTYELIGNMWLEKKSDGRYGNIISMVETDSFFTNFFSLFWGHCFY